MKNMISENMTEKCKMEKKTFTDSYKYWEHSFLKVRSYFYVNYVLSWYLFDDLYL